MGRSIFGIPIKNKLTPIRIDSIIDNREIAQSKLVAEESEILFQYMICESFDGTVRLFNMHLLKLNSKPEYYMSDDCFEVVNEDTYRPITYSELKDIVSYMKNDGQLSLF